MTSNFSVRSIFALLFALSLNVWAADTTQDKIDDELGRVVSLTYTRLAASAKTPKNLQGIYERAKSAYAAEDYAGALRILAENRALDTSHLGDVDLQKTIRLALQLYAHVQIEKLLLDTQGDALAESTLLFELARFYAANQQWSKVIKLLTNQGPFEQLNKNDLAEAYVLLGTALQKEKKHREAIRFYEKIEAGSEHFRIAQLNLASALLRQEWWTDAHIAIKAALNENKSKRNELDYRLYTMMGFSQIQFGFYRDARESFRNVAISSQYSQRALLGIGIAALHQQDFIGALNAFDKLRIQPQKDISVAEAHLLSAFTLRQLEQFDAATLRYQEAIDYYQILSGEIQATISSPTAKPIHFLRLEHNRDRLIQNNSRKIALLNGLSDLGLSESSATSALNNKILNASAMRAKQLLNDEKNAIDSYLSQSRFGLASLYDSK